MKQDERAKWYFRVPKSSDDKLEEVCKKLDIPKSAALCLAVARLHSQEVDGKLEERKEP